MCIGKRNFDSVWCNFDRCGILNRAWWALLKLRWPSHDHPTQAVSWLDKHGEGKTVSMNDWQQMYWEKHLQEYAMAQQIK